MKVKPGDTVIVDESLTYKHFGRKYKALVLWNSFNGQPLLTHVDKWSPHWSSYSSIDAVIGHVDFDYVVAQFDAEVTS